MNVLVTGGAGFIGAHVVRRLLAEGHRVTVLDDFNDFYAPRIKRANTASFGAGASLVEGDVRDRALVESIFAANAIDAVVHLAARAGVRPSIENPGLYVETNINGTFNVLEAARAHGVTQFVFASSSSVYGVNKKVPFAEDDRIARTISPYAATKLAGEQLCSNYAEHYGMRVVCLRFFTVYGPGQRPDLAISKFVDRIENGIPIEQYGDGSSGRDYTYIDDIVAGVVAAVRYNRSDFEVINLGGAHTVKLSELIEIVEEATGKKATIEVKPDQPGDVPLTSADVRKAKALLGYSPETPIVDGVRKYVEWYREHLAPDHPGGAGAGGHQPATTATA